MDNLILYRGEAFNSNFYYFSKCDIDHALFLSKGEKRYLFVPEMNQLQAEKEFDGEIIVYKDLFKELKPFINGKMFSIDASSLSTRFYIKLRKLCSLQDVSEKLSVIRAVKDKNELEQLIKAAKISKKILGAVDFSDMRTEMDIRHYLLASTLKHKAEPAFEPIVASDRNASLPHYRPGNIKLGNMVLIDYAVKYNHYCADLTRCFFLKQDKQKKAAYETTKQIFHEIVDELPNLRTGKQLAILSEKLFRKYRLPQLIHSIGHGVGLDVHEFPRLSRRFNDKLAKSVLAIEPAAYFRDFGVRFEDLVYFDGKKGRIL